MGFYGSLKIHDSGMRDSLPGEETHEDVAYSDY